MNQKVSVYLNKRQNWRIGRRFWWLTVAMLALTACSLLNRAPALGDSTELQGPAVVTCSATCAERGQCGTTREGSRVVLGGQMQPVVENHERMFPDGSPVNILETRVEVVETLVTAEQFQLRFYHIQPPDRLDGWVAGWCLAAQ